MKPGIVTFAGAGPGAPDLLTVRAHAAIADADVIVYAGSLVSPEVLAHAKASCVRHDSAGLDLDATTKILVEGASAGLRVLRLHTGDPAIYGATAEQMRRLDAAGIAYETIPGVSAAFAAAAALNAELTQPGITQTVMISRRAGRTPVPEREAIAGLAKHGTSLALYLSVSDMPGLVSELLAAGAYRKDTAAAVVYRASWPDEKIVRGHLGDIAEKVTAAGITRQALILVGDALGGQGDDSLLYDSSFSHGYRAASTKPAVAKAEPVVTECEPLVRFGGRVAVYGLTGEGVAQAQRLAAMLDASAFVSEKHTPVDVELPANVQRFAPEDLGALVAGQWTAFDAHVFVMATGIVVRKIADLLQSKEVDPAVVVMDEKAGFAQSLVGGHLGGANRLVGDIARLTGAQAVVSTGTDTQGLLAFDELAALQGWRIENRDGIVALNAALLEGKCIGLLGFTPKEAAGYADVDNVSCYENLDTAEAAELLVCLDTPLGDDPRPCLLLTRLPLVVGVGCKRGVSAERIEAAIHRSCLRYGIDPARIQHLASVDVKADEVGMLEVAKTHDWETHFLTAAELEQQAVPNPSTFVCQNVATPSVAEASVRACGRGRLLTPKQKDDGVTVALGTMGSLTAAADTGPKRGIIYAIGLGPGTRAGMTEEARQAIRGADKVVGYTTYCRQVRWLTQGRQVYSTGMRSEIERCDEAVRMAASGQSVALICSGDSGIYGMAGLILERVEAMGEDSVDVEVIAGVTSSSSAAAAVGAPLMNDFATISLSDLLTPREWIKKRVNAVAEAGLVCTLYNPRSRKRRELLDEVLATFAAHRGDQVPVALVRDAGRPKQWKWVGPLKDLPIDEIGMTTMLIIGNEQTRMIHGQMVTQRGYQKKEAF